LIQQNKVIVLDIDGTICEEKQPDVEYSSLHPKKEMVEKLREYKTNGFHIIFHTSRNMRSFGGNLGKINTVTAPLLLDWLKQHEIPYDEIYFAKPWCGFDGFYVDDRSVRPSEFLSKSFEEIQLLLDDEYK